MAKPYLAKDMTLADVRMVKKAADKRGPAGEVRRDTDTAVVRNVAGPAPDAVRRAAIAARVAEKEPKAAVVVAKKPVDPAGPMGGPTVPGAIKNLKQRPGRLNREIDKQTGY